MTLFTRISPLFLLALAVPAHAAGLNDTGQDTCYDGSALVVCSAANSGDNATYPRQDGAFGRDADATTNTLNKVGAGAAGFDFNKVANDGSVLAAGAALGIATTDWACTRDNVTSLTWEVKTTSGLRSKDNTYTWYSTDATSNGGNAGTANGGTCTGSNCDTDSYVAAANAATLCGHNDWRLPSLGELQSLEDFSVPITGAAPPIDAAYFPNTQVFSFWTSNSYASSSAYAWSVNFSNGNPLAGVKWRSYHVRLVRGGQ